MQWIHNAPFLGTFPITNLHSFPSILDALSISLWSLNSFSRREGGTGVNGAWFTRSPSSHKLLYLSTSLSQEIQSGLSFRAARNLERDRIFVFLVAWAAFHKSSGESRSFKKIHRSAPPKLRRFTPRSLGCTAIGYSNAFTFLPMAQKRMTGGSLYIWQRTFERQCFDCICSQNYLGHLQSQRLRTSSALQKVFLGQPWERIWYCWTVSR